VVRARSLSRTKGIRPAGKRKNKTGARGPPVDAMMTPGPRDRAVADSFVRQRSIRAAAGEAPRRARSMERMHASKAGRRVRCFADVSRCDGPSTPGIEFGLIDGGAWRDADAPSDPIGLRRVLVLTQR